MRLIIDTDHSTRGDINDFLRETIRQIDRGYVVGEGWEIKGSDSEGDEAQDTTGDDDQDAPETSVSGPESTENAPEGTTVEQGQTTPPEAPQQATEGVDPGVSTVTEEKEPWNQNQ